MNNKANKNIKIDIDEINLKEFKNSIYNKYTELFPEEEQRELNEIEETYNKGVEKFYKITSESKNIGFFMLEKINDNYPFYLDYFAIFKEFQNQGYGSKALVKLLDRIGTNNGLICEIEKECLENPITIKRFDFYSKIGFKRTGSEYLLYNVHYTPLIYINSDSIIKENADKIFFEYYRENCGEKKVKKNCKIIK